MEWWGWLLIFATWALLFDMHKRVSRTMDAVKRIEAHLNRSGGRD